MLHIYLSEIFASQSNHKHKKKDKSNTLLKEHSNLNEYAKFASEYKESDAQNYNSKSKMYKSVTNKHDVFEMNKYSDSDIIIFIKRKIEDARSIIDQLYDYNHTADKHHYENLLENLKWTIDDIERKFTNKFDQG